MALSDIFLVCVFVTDKNTYCVGKYLEAIVLGALLEDEGKRSCSVVIIAAPRQTEPLTAALELGIKRSISTELEQAVRRLTVISDFRGI